MIDLSVIIPCKNERLWIARCLDALLKQKEKGARLEIIVVDNGSTDGTQEILASYGPTITYFILTGVAISELRNHGVRHARGQWLAFIDADVTVCENWYESLNRAISDMQQKGQDVSKILTGSTYLIPEKPTWVERVWFQQLVARDKAGDNYINGGNLIVSKHFFMQLGGFRSDYQTGEDVKLCQDAVGLGGKIMKVEAIAAVHHGYPKTVRAFFKRERWHGLGMKQYLRRPWQLKDLLLALYFLVLAFIFILVVSFWPQIAVLAGGTGLAFFLPIFVLASVRSGGEPKTLFPLTFLYFVYGWARVFSLFDIVQQAIILKSASVKPPGH